MTMHAEDTVGLLVGSHVEAKIGLRVRRVGCVDDMAVGTIEKVIKRFASGKHDSPTLSVGVRWDGQRDTELQLYKTGLAGKYELVLSSSIEGAKMEEFFSSLAAGELQEGPKAASQEEERGGSVEVEEVDKAERKASFSTAMGLEKDLGFCPSPSKTDRRMRRAASGAENAGIVNEQGGEEERIPPGSEKKGGGVDGQPEGSGSLWKPGSFSLHPHNKEPTQIQEFNISKTRKEIAMERKRKILSMVSATAAFQAGGDPAAGHLGGAKLSFH